MKLNPKQIQSAMKKMGMKTEELEVEKVVFSCKNKNLVIKNPSVTKIKMGNKSTFQVMGEIEEKEKEKFNEDDIKIVVNQTGCSSEEAKKTLKDKGDIAEAIMKLKEEKK